MAFKEMVASGKTHQKPPHPGNTVSVARHPIDKADPKMLQVIYWRLPHRLQPLEFSCLTFPLIFYGRNTIAWPVFA
jgi:hypothetical protein